MLTKDERARTRDAAYDYIVANPGKTFRTIELGTRMRMLDPPWFDDRQFDRILQSLRKAGKIKYTKGGWHAVTKKRRRK